MNLRCYHLLGVFLPHLNTKPTYHAEGEGNEKLPTLRYRHVSLFQARVSGGGCEGGGVWRVEVMW